MRLRKRMMKLTLNRKASNQDVVDILFDYLVKNSTMTESKDYPQTFSDDRWHESSTDYVYTAVYQCLIPKKLNEDLAEMDGKEFPYYNSVYDITKDDATYKQLCEKLENHYKEEVMKNLPDMMKEIVDVLKVTPDYLCLYVEYDDEDDVFEFALSVRLLYVSDEKVDKIRE